MRPTRNLPLVLLLLALALLVERVSLAQTPTPVPPADRKGEVEARVEVVLISVDVLALDRKERPVTDLTAAEVTVKVDGKVLPLAFFEPPPPASAAPPETLAGTTATLERVPGARTRLLFFVDLESIPLPERSDLVKVLRDRLTQARAGTTLSLVSHYVAPQARVWDEQDILRVESEVERMGELAAEEASSAEAVVPGQRRAAVAGVPSPASYERRQALESALIRAVVDADQMAQSGDTRALMEALRDVQAHLSGERERARETARGLRETVERFAAGGGKRQVFLVSGGFERLPGQSFLARLAAARAAARSTGLAPRQADSGLPGFPGVGSPLGFQLGRVPEMESLEDWLASSGVALHFVDASALPAGPSAADASWDRNRDTFSERRNFQDGPARLADLTGGLQRRPSTLESLLLAASATYRLGVRLPEPHGKGPWKVSVATTRKGVTIRHQSSFQANGTQTPAKADVALAEVLAADARRDERKESPVRLAQPPLPVTARFVGKLRADAKTAGRNVYAVEVSVPHEELKFMPAEDGFLASARLSVTATGIGTTSGADEVTLELSPGYTSEEFVAARDKPLVRSLMLSLSPGRYRITAAVNDLIAERGGVATLEVVAGR